MNSTILIEDRSLLPLLNTSRVKTLINGKEMCTGFTLVLFFLKCSRLFVAGRREETGATLAMLSLRDLRYQPGFRTVRARIAVALSFLA